MTSFLYPVASQREAFEARAPSLQRGCPIPAWATTEGGQALLPGSRSVCRSCGQHENCNYIYEIFIDGIEVAAHADGEGRFSNFIEILNF